jgi:hypothetical protein
MTPQQQQQYASDVRARNMMQPMGGGQQRTQQMTPYQQAVANYNAARTSGNAQAAQNAWNQASQVYGNMSPQQRQQMWNYYGPNQGNQTQTPPTNAGRPVNPGNDTYPQKTY